MKIVLTTENKAKISAVKDVIDYLFKSHEYELMAIELESDGPEPMGEESLIKAIKANIRRAQEIVVDGDYYIGMEGGIVDRIEYLEEVACVIVEDLKNNQIGISKAASFQIPPVISKDVREGSPFAEAVEKYFKVKNIKQEGGFVSILTKGLVSKKELYSQPLAIAFSKVLNKEWYTK